MKLLYLKALGMLGLGVYTLYVLVSSEIEFKKNERELKRQEEIAEERKRERIKFYKERDKREAEIKRIRKEGDEKLRQLRIKMEVDKAKIEEQKRLEEKWL